MGRVQRLSIRTVQEARVRLEPGCAVTVLAEQCTSNEPKSVPTPDMRRLVDATCSSDGLSKALRVLWRRLETDVPRSPQTTWHKALRTLQVIEYLVLHGSDAAVDALASGRTITSLSNLGRVGYDSSLASSETIEGVRLVRAKAVALIDMLRDCEALARRRAAAARLSRKCGGDSPSAAEPRSRGAYSSAARASPHLEAEAEAESWGAPPALPPRVSTGPGANLAAASKQRARGDYLPPSVPSEDFGEFVRPAAAEEAHEAATQRSADALDASLGIGSPAAASPAPASPPQPPAFSIDPFASLLMDLGQRLEAGGAAAPGAAAAAEPLCETAAAAWAVGGSSPSVLASASPLSLLDSSPPKPDAFPPNVQALLQATEAQRRGAREGWGACVWVSAPAQTQPSTPTTPPTPEAAWERPMAGFLPPPPQRAAGGAAERSLIDL